MNDPREQIEQLLSRLLDGDLTAEERARLLRALEADDELAAAGRAYDRLNRLLASWRVLPGDLDWQGLSRRLAGRVEDALGAAASAELDRAIDPAAVNDEAASESTASPRADAVARSYRRTEALLRDWAGPLPPVDWHAFKTRVSDAVRREAARAPRPAAAVRGRRAAGWLTPLAAAAAIALVVWWPRGVPSIRSGEQAAGAPLILVALDVPPSSGRVSVAFDETPAEASPPAEPGPGGAAIAIGPAWSEIAAPPDEAYFY